MIWKVIYSIAILLQSSFWKKFSTVVVFIVICNFIRKKRMKKEEKKPRKNRVHEFFMQPFDADFFQAFSQL